MIYYAASRANKPINKDKDKERTSKMRKYVIIEDSQNLAKENEESDSIYNIRAVAICDTDEEAVSKAVEFAQKQKAYCIRGGWKKITMGFHNDAVYVTAFGDKRTWTCSYKISIVD